MHRLITVLLGPAALAALWLAAGSVRGEDPGPPAAAEDPLVTRGYAVTGGAAPGYVDDRVCGSCHADLYASYQEVAMAKAFHRPRPDMVIEDFDDNRFYHAKSKRHYQMLRRDGAYVFRRFQIDAGRRQVNVFEQEVDWILGSGNHARTYLFRVPGGEIYQLPVAWYSQTGTWGMAPGYDRPDHEGVTRRVRRECMFCHNAYPDVAPGSDLHGEPQVFPEQLPEGLGCQRCHGPGAEHARIGLGEDIDFRRLANSIVNPGRLPAARRNDVCYGCHMQPSVALSGVRRFGRGDYSLKPGEPLADYLFEVDVKEDGRERSQRFEINHHAYRLEQSRCFVESAGAMSCLTCHDPHRKVPAAQRPAHYRAACLSCHEIDACGLEAMTEPGGAAASGAPDPDHCVACHMPPRRPQDVVRVVMTDHFIRRRPGGAELLAPLAESTPVLVDVEPLDPLRSPPGNLAELYRVVAVVQAGGGADAVERLAAMLEGGGVEPVDPYLDLARGQLKQTWAAKARQTLAEILKRSPGNPLAEEWLGIAADRLGQRPEALERMRRAVDRRPDRAEAHFNLGRLLSGYGQGAEAVAQFERALALRPNMASAWLHLGHAHRGLGHLDQAAECFRRALAVDPSYTDAYLALGWTLWSQGEKRAALDSLRHGARVAAQPEAIEEALVALESDRSDVSDKSDSSGSDKP